MGPEVGCPDAAPQDRSRSASRAFQILEDPKSEFEPSKPQWLSQAADWAQNGLPKDLCVPEPPSLQQLRPEGKQNSSTFGAAARADHFVLDPHVHFLNHGSYGAALRVALEAQQFYQMESEHQLVKYNEATVFALLLRACDQVAELIHAAPSDVVPVVNASAAVNTVLASTQLHPGDLIMTTSITYNAVKNAVARTTARHGAGMLEVCLSLEVLQKCQGGILEAWKAALEATRKPGGSRVVLAVIDHVASFPPVHMPVQEMAAACKAYGIAVLVDGAHAVGALPLDVPSLGVDFYTANLHKWLCTPKGAAFLWVAPQQQPHIRPLVTSHGFGMGFKADFLWPGTCDWTAWAAVPAALAVQRMWGLDSMRRYNHDLLLRALRLLGSKFKLAAVLGGEAEHATMAAFQLPSLRDFPLEAASGPQLHYHLRDRYQVEIPITWWADRLWGRISAQVHNTLDQYQKLADAICELQQPPD